jgi:hypothetical protein
MLEVGVLEVLMHIVRETVLPVVKVVAEMELI